MYYVARTGRTWAIKNVDGKVVEGGFFSREVADEACTQWNGGLR